MTEPMLTPADLVEAWQVAESTLAGWRKHGVGPRWVRLGPRRIGYPLSEVRAYEKQHASQ